MSLAHAIADFLAIKEAENLSAKTVADYRQQLHLFVQSLPPAVADVEEITTAHCAAFLAAERARGLSPYTIHSRYRTLRVFLRWASAEMDFRNPLTFKAPRVRIQPPRRAEGESVSRLLDSIAQETWLDVRDRAIIHLLHGTGVRVQECADLHIADVDVSRRLLYVADGKGHKARYVPFSSPVAVAVTGYLYNRPACAVPHLLLGAVNRHGQPEGPLSAGGIRQMLERRCKAAGLPYINPHSLRHLFATKALNDGIPLSAVSRMMGHTSTDFTARVYARWLTDGLARVYDEHWK